MVGESVGIYTEVLILELLNAEVQLVIFSFCEALILIQENPYIIKFRELRVRQWERVDSC